MVSDPPAPELDSLDPREIEELEDLLDYLDDRVPEPYRIPLFTHLLQRLLPAPPTPSRAGVGGQTPLAREPATHLDLHPYRGILARRGRNLLKSLAALDAADRQLGTSWLTPRDVVDLLEEHWGSESIYRSNISNALRTAGPLVERREEGRGYAYRITREGRDRLARELKLRPPE